MLTLVLLWNAHLQVSEDRRFLGPFQCLRSGRRPKGPTLEVSLRWFLKAMDISAYSFVATVRAAAPYFCLRGERTDPFLLGASALCLEQSDGCCKAA